MNSAWLCSISSSFFSGFAPGRSMNLVGDLPDPEDLRRFSLSSIPDPPEATGPGPALSPRDMSMYDFKGSRLREAAEGAGLLPVVVELPPAGKRHLLFGGRRGLDPEVRAGDAGPAASVPEKRTPAA